MEENSREQRLMQKLPYRSSSAFCPELRMQHLFSPHQAWGPRPHSVTAASSFQERHISHSRLLHVLQQLVDAGPASSLKIIYIYREKWTKTKIINYYHAQSIGNFKQNIYVKNVNSFVQQILMSFFYELDPAYTAMNRTEKVPASWIFQTSESNKQ